MKPTELAKRAFRHILRGAKMARAIAWHARTRWGDRIRPAWLGSLVLILLANPASYPARQAASGKAEGIGNRLYFADGTTRPGFQEYLDLVNHGPATTVSLRFLLTDEPRPRIVQRRLEGHSRDTIDVNQLVGGGEDVSVAVDAGSGGNVAVERTVFFNACLPLCADGSHVVRAVHASRSWYFAAGGTGPGFQQNMVLFNPGHSRAKIRLTFVLDHGVTERSLTLLPESRTTLPLNNLLAPDQQVSVAVTADQAIVAERSIYFDACPGGICVKGGTATPGLAPDTAWTFPAGGTGPGAQEYLTLFNPARKPSGVKVTYANSQGQAVSTRVQLEALAHTTVDVNQVLGSFQEVSVTVAAQHPIVAERLHYSAIRRPLYSRGGTLAAGLHPATIWDLAAGAVGPGRRMYITIANPDSLPASVSIQYVSGDGGSQKLTTTLQPGARAEYDVGQAIAVPGAVSAWVESDLPIVAERTLYASGCVGSQPVCINVPPVAPAFRITVDDCGTEAQIRGVIKAVDDRHLSNAWFFPTGLCAQQFPWLVPTLLEKGYQVCNHSFSHAKMTVLSDSAIASEISRGVSWQTTGCHHLRPPYGAYDSRVVRIAASLGYDIALWDIDTRDWAGTSAGDMLSMIQGHSGTVLVHFHGAHTIETLQQL